MCWANWLGEVFIDLKKCAASTGWSVSDITGGSRWNLHWHACGCQLPGSSLLGQISSPLLMCIPWTLLFREIWVLALQEVVYLEVSTCIDVHVADGQLDPSLVGSVSSPSLMCVLRDLISGLMRFPVPWDDVCLDAAGIPIEVSAGAEILFFIFWPICNLHCPHSSCIMCTMLKMHWILFCLNFSNMETWF